MDLISKAKAKGWKPRYLFELMQLHAEKAKLGQKVDPQEQRLGQIAPVYEAYNGITDSQKRLLFQ